MAEVKTKELVYVNFKENLKCYAQLFKLKLTSFVVISAVFGYFIGAATYNFSEILLLIVGGFLITCSSNAYNQIIEKNFDKLMDRTKIRPLPQNKLSVTETIWVASSISILGIVLLWLLNPLTGILGALAIFMYVALYTPLKRVSTISVFVGAFPGAFPPMLGYVAATGSFGLEAGILFAIQFLWQFIHFWAIAWRLNDDYKKAGFKMLPFGKKGRATATIILISSIALFGISFVPEYLHIAGRITTVGLAVLSLFMMYPAFRLLKTLNDKFALRVMLMSYLYLVFSLAVILIDRIL